MSEELPTKMASVKSKNLKRWSKVHKSNDKATIGRKIKVKVGENWPQESYFRYVRQMVEEEKLLKMIGEIDSGRQGNYYDIETRLKYR